MREKQNWLFRPEWAQLWSVSPAQFKIPAHSGWLHLKFEPIINWKMMKITAEEIRSRGAFGSFTCLNLCRSKHAATFWTTLCTLCFVQYAVREKHTHTIFWKILLSLINVLSCFSFVLFLFFIFLLMFQRQLLPSFSHPSVLNLCSNFLSFLWEISVVVLKTVLTAKLSSYGFLF